MLHLMTVTKTVPSLFRRGQMTTITNKYLLTWEGVKKTLNDTRDVAKSFNGTYSISLVAYRGQPLD